MNCLMFVLLLSQVFVFFWSNPLFFGTRPRLDCIVHAVLLFMQVILAFGNYMNTSKRGPAYGFKLQSLDMVRVPSI